MLLQDFKSQPENLADYITQYLLATRSLSNQ